MSTYRTERLAPDTAGIDRAAELLRQGELVGFPTETVYGLGADASNPDAVKKIYEAKRRPIGHPLIVHIEDLPAIDRWAANWFSDSSDTARALAAAFWPGPLTLIVPRTDEVVTEVVGGRTTVGLRVPDQPVALKLLRSFGGGVAAPSANRFGGVSPSTANHVLDDLDGRIAAVVMADPCEVGIESTIAEVTSNQITVLRPGAVTAQMLKASAGNKVELLEGRNEVSRAPGMLNSHYSPVTPSRIVSSESLEEAYHSCGRAAVIASFPLEYSDSWQLPSDAAGFGQELYSALRLADGCGADEILIVPPDHGELFDAVMDRLNKASAVAKRG